MMSKLQPLDQGVIKCLKCHYRRRILKKTIKCFEKNKKINITLMDCVDEITDAWNIDIKSDTISNCFKKAGFGQYREWEEDDEIPLIFLCERTSEKSEEETLLQMEYEVWENFRSTQGATLNDFIHVDDDIITSDIPTDEDIVELYRSESSQLSDESDITETELQEEQLQAPANELVANSLSILRLFLKTNEHTTDVLYNSLNNIQAFSKSKIVKNPLISHE